jgi:hypothetical protein
MKINPFWVATLIVLLLISMLNYTSMLKSAQDPDFHSHPGLPRNSRQQVPHNASDLPGLSAGLDPQVWAFTLHNVPVG